MDLDKKKMMLLGGLVVAVGTGIAALTFLDEAPEQVQAQIVAPAPKGPQVLVAQRALPVGTIITADSVTYQPWPNELIKDAYFKEGESDMASLLGTVVREPVTAGGPITRGSLVSPKDRGFLAAALGPGMRAITIPVDVKTGVGGFIFPGDRVDVMLTQSIKGVEGPPLNTVETIVRNIRVLATDQSTTTSKGDNGEVVVKTFQTVTVETTPRISEKITVAQNIGAVSLSLRSIADNQSELDRAIASGNVKLPEGASKAEEDRILSQMTSGPIEGGTTALTGGDVSRFQRRTVPPQTNQAAAGFGPRVATPVGAPAAAAPERKQPVIRVHRGSAQAE